MEFDSLRNNVILECEKNEEKLTSSWLPGIINIYADKNNFASVQANKADRFFSCVSTLISNQVKHQETHLYISQYMVINTSAVRHQEILVSTHRN